MVNYEHNLTIDDLIVEYIMYKVNNGYEPKFSGHEFMEFLSFFEESTDIYVVPYSKEEIFESFFKRKIKQDWFIYGIDNEEITRNEHMHKEYSEKDSDYIISAGYKLSDYDKSVINTYFMDGGMSKYDNYEGTAWKIRKIIAEFVGKQEKRKIDSNVIVSEEEALIGKYLAAGIVKEIWKSHISFLIESSRWPKQCTDINKYLLENDLASMIELPSIKDELIDMYNTLANRIAIMYHDDKDLKITSNSTSYLANANYKLLIQGYETVFADAFKNSGKSLKIDLTIDLFEETHELSGAYDFDDDIDTKSTSSQIGNDKVKKIVRNIENKKN